MNKLKYIFILLLVFSMGCGDKFLDINEDPLAINEGNSGQQLTQTELNLGAIMSYGGVGLPSYLGTIIHHNTYALGDYYFIPPADYALETGWDNAYVGALMDIEDIITRSKENGDMIYSGICKVLKAYIYSILVDVYGDVPFSQACNIDQYPMPKWDDDEEIYRNLLTLLDQAISEISDNEAVNNNVPTNQDIIYNGDTQKWITLANSLKLKLYNNARLVDNFYDANAVNQLISGDIISNVNQDFQVPFINQQEPENRNPGYNQYSESADKFDISPWFYELLIGVNPDRFTGITDPRIPYFWFNPRDDGGEPENDPEYFDTETNFISTIFCSDGPYKNAAIEQSVSIMGIYPIGGRFNDGNGGTISLNNSESNGTGQAPVRLLNFYDMLFIRAELAQVGKTAENPRDLLGAAISASFEHIDYVVASTGTKQDVPAITGTEAMTNFIDAVLAEYDAENDAGKLEIIMTQKWIAHFGAPVDCYADYRRTGYPVLFDPNDGKLQRGPAGHEDFTAVSRSFPYSFPWPTSDLDLNSNAPEQKLPGTDQAKVFWDKD